MFILEKFNEFDEILSLEDLRKKYKNIIFTMSKEKKGYIVRADIKKQSEKTEYLGALKGYVSEKQGLEFLNRIAKTNYDKYY